MGLFSGVAVQNAYGQQKVDSPFKIDISVKGDDGKERLTSLKIADNTCFALNFDNKKEYGIMADREEKYLLFFDENIDGVSVLPLNEEQFAVIRHLAAVDGKPDELSATDVQLVNTQNLNLPNFRVTHIKNINNEDLPPDAIDALIEKTNNGETVSFINAYVLLLR